MDREIIKQVVLEQESANKRAIPGIERAQLALSSEPPRLPASALNIKSSCCHNLHLKASLLLKSWFFEVNLIFLKKAEILFFNFVEIHFDLLGVRRSLYSRSSFLIFSSKDS